MTAPSEPLLRLRLDFAYDGTDFVGWAAQPGLRSVQGVLTQALSTVLRVPPPPIVTAGRTDAGVHALGAVCQVDVPVSAWSALPGRGARTPEQAALARLSAVLPDDVAVHRVSVAPEGFDARFSALWRRYRYRLLDRPESADPVRRRDTVSWRRPLADDALAAAGACLLGLRDFGAFCKPRPGATTVRTLLDFSWRRDDDGVLVATVRADAFCHSMVRALVGAVVAVGEGRRDLAWLASIRDAAVRCGQVQVMPARGLTLLEVGYPADEELAARAAQARATRPVLSRNDSSSPGLS